MVENAVSGGTTPGAMSFDAGVRALIAGDNETAVSQLQAAVEAEPGHDEVHYVLGLALLRLGRQEEAVTALRYAANNTQNIMLREYATTKLAQALPPEGA